MPMLTQLDQRLAKLDQCWAKFPNLTELWPNLANFLPTRPSCSLGCDVEGSPLRPHRPMARGGRFRVAREPLQSGVGDGARWGQRARVVSLVRYVARWGR